MLEDSRPMSLLLKRIDPPRAPQVKGAVLVSLAVTQAPRFNAVTDITLPTGDATVYWRPIDDNCPCIDGMIVQRRGPLLRVFLVQVTLAKHHPPSAEHMHALLTHLAKLGVANVSMLWVVDGQQQLATFQPLDVSKLKAKKTILGLQ